MSASSLDNLPKGWKSVPNDLGSDQTAFKGVQWGKAMMWIFLLSDTFIFSCFLISYMKGGLHPSLIGQILAKYSH